MKDQDQLLLFATSQRAAREAGLTTYIGKPCIKCGSNIRFVNNRNCTECNKLRLSEYRQSNENCEKARQYKKAHRSIATKQVREWRRVNPGRAKEISKRSHDNRQKIGKRYEYDLVRKYGLTFEEFTAMSASQGHVCAICNAPWSDTKIPQVDHHHGTGKIRGLLCGPCNRAIGLLNDNPCFTERATIYLKDHND